jgi:hypothetical protein
MRGAYLQSHINGEFVKIDFGIISLDQQADLCCQLCGQDGREYLGLENKQTWRDVFSLGNTVSLINVHVDDSNVVKLPIELLRHAYVNTNLDCILFFLKNDISFPLEKKDFEIFFSKCVSPS